MVGPGTGCLWDRVHSGLAVCIATSTFKRGLVKEASLMHAILHPEVTCKLSCQIKFSL